VTATLAAQMDGLKGLLVAASITPSVFEWPVESVTPPASIIGYPEAPISIHDVFQAPSGEIEFPLWVVVGRTSTKDARDQASGYIETVPVALEGVQSFGAVLVKTAEFAFIVVGQVPYLSLKFIVGVLS
jgi:hypothetical protein